ncbi:hypothetical protein ACOMHN_026108 [Nucella lapillus]
MAASQGQSTSFDQAVSIILSRWTALQLAVEHGCGGPNSKQKSLDLQSIVQDLFNTNRSLDPYDLAEFLEDELDDRFGLDAQDGSVYQVCGNICQCFKLLKEGRVAEVEQFLQGFSSAPLSKVQCGEQEDDSSSDEDGEEEDMENSSPQPQQCSSQQQQDSTPSTNGAGDAAMDVEEEDDGWTVVKKGGRKK